MPCKMSNLTNIIFYFYYIFTGKSFIRRLPMSKFTTPEWQTLFDDLLFDLRRRACVLMIGPEMTQAGGKPIQRQLRDTLSREHAEDIEHYYEKDAFFLFKNLAAKSKVQRGVSKFYDRIKADEAIFDTVAAIPFPLIISLNPDDFLEKSLKNNRVRHFSSYFNHGAGNNGHRYSDSWDGESPLVYNLCGSMDSDASLLLDYDDLFSFLKNVLGAVGLPDNVRSMLKKAKSFLFVGFQFDRWYTQLLLRLLNEDNSPAHLALNTQLGDKDTHHFLLNRFHMQFLGRVLAEDKDRDGMPDISAAEFLTELARRWQEAQAARGEDDTQPDKNTVRRLVEKGDLEKALDTLMKIATDPEDRDMVTMLCNWFNNWKREIIKGAEDSRTLDNRYNKVLNGILELLKTLPG